MLTLIIPLSALLITFLASLACIRFLLTRRGRIYWIIPVFISLILFYYNLRILLEYGSSTLLYPVTFDSVLPLVLSIFWYGAVISFHYALKTEREYNKFVEESRATHAEAAFVEKVERRELRKERREKTAVIRNRTSKPVIPGYDFPSEKY